MTTKTIKGTTDRIKVAEYHAIYINFWKERKVKNGMDGQCEKSVE